MQTDAAKRKSLAHCRKMSQFVAISRIPSWTSSNLAELRNLGFARLYATVFPKGFNAE